MSSARCDHALRRAEDPDDVEALPCPWPECHAGIDQTFVLEKAFTLEIRPAAPRLKRRGRPRKTISTIEKPEPTFDGCTKDKALEACRIYLQVYPRGAYLARWFREGQQDLRAVELQARARGDERTANLAAQLQALGPDRATAHAALSLPRDFGRVKPESAP